MHTVTIKLDITHDPRTGRPLPTVVDLTGHSEQRGKLDTIARILAAHTEIANEALSREQEAEDLRAAADHDERLAAEYGVSVLELHEHL